MVSLYEILRARPLPLIRIVSVVCLLLSLFASIGTNQRGVFGAGPGDVDPALYAPVLAAERDAVFDETEGELSRFRVNTEFTPVNGDDPASIAGYVDLLFVNETGESMNELYFRLYPNIPSYAEGEMSINSAVIDGNEQSVELSVDKTVATVSLPATVESGASIDIHIDFTTTIPTDPIGSYGMFSYDGRNDSYALAHWLPLLAGYDPVTGWLLDSPSMNGDPVFTNTGLFDVTVTAPDDLIFVTTGSEQDSTPSDNKHTTHHFVSGPVRDFVMAIDGDFSVLSQEVDGTTVNSYFNPGNETGGATVLEAGVQSLDVYNRLIGNYPFQEMDLIEIDLGNGAGGVEFPQLMFIGSDYYKSGSSSSIPHFLEFIVAHEVGHQWFYGVVGNNQYDHAFLDEGLVNFLTTVYFGEMYGPEAEKEQVNYNLKASYFSVLFDDLDDVVDQPTDDFGSQRAYGAIIYGKASLGFAAIRDEIGNDAFFAGLQEYFSGFRFGVAAPNDLQSALEQASGEKLDELWRHWFDSAEGREDFNAADLAVLLREIGQ